MVLLTSTSTPAPGQRFTMIRGSATTSASCTRVQGDRGFMNDFGSRNPGVLDPEP